MNSQSQIEQQHKEWRYKFDVNSEVTDVFGAKLLHSNDDLKNMERPTIIQDCSKIVSLNYKSQKIELRDLDTLEIIKEIDTHGYFIQFFNDGEYFQNQIDDSQYQRCSGYLYELETLTTEIYNLNEYLEDVDKNRENNFFQYLKVEKVNVGDTMLQFFKFSETSILIINEKDKGNGNNFIIYNFPECQKAQENKLKYTLSIPIGDANSKLDNDIKNGKVDSTKQNKFLYKYECFDSQEIRGFYSVHKIAQFSLFENLLIFTTVENTLCAINMSYEKFKTNFIETAQFFKGDFKLDITSNVCVQIEESDSKLSFFQIINREYKQDKKEMIELNLIGIIDSNLKIIKYIQLVNDQMIFVFGVQNEKDEFLEILMIDAYTGRLINSYKIENLTTLQGFQYSKITQQFYLYNIYHNEQQYDDVQELFNLDFLYSSFNTVDKISLPREYKIQTFMSSKNSILLYKYDKKAKCYVIRTEGFTIGTINFEKGTVEDTKFIKEDTIKIRKVFEFQENDNLGIIIEIQVYVKLFVYNCGNLEKIKEIKVNNYSEISLIYKQENGSKWYACAFKDSVHFYNLEQQQFEKGLDVFKKPTFQIQTPLQESIKTIFLNTNNQLLYISTNNSLYHYDMTNNVFLLDLTINTQLKTQFSFINAENQLVLLNQGYQTDIYNLSYKQNKWFYSQKVSIDNSRGLKIDFDKADENITFIKDYNNSTAFILENSFEFEEKIFKHYSVFRVSTLVGSQTNGSPYKFDFFHYQDLKRQTIPWQTLEIEQLNQKFTLYDDMENQIIGFIQQSYNTQDIQKFLNYRNSSLTDVDIMNNIKKEGNLKKLLMYYPQIGNILNLVISRPRVIEYLIKQFQLLNSSELPILIFLNDQQSPLDVAIKANQIKSVSLYLDLIVKFQNNHSFNYLIDKNLISLIQKSISLSEYFESNLPIIKVNNKNYPDLHFDDQEIIVGIDCIDQPRDLLDKYNEILGQELQQNQDGDQQQFPIEYHLINFPETLTKEPTKLMKVLSETDNMELFDALAIQTIINFKWKQYTKSFFQTQFNIFLIFCFTFLFEIMYSFTNVDRKSDPPVDQRNIYVFCLLKSLATIVLTYFLIYETKQALKQENYFKEIWNFFDYMLILTYIGYIILEIFTPFNDSVIIIKLIIVFLSFLKVNFFLRIYDGFSFLVSMMAAVFVDLKYFIGFFLIFILEFGIVFAILFDATAIEEYQGIGISAYMMMAFRTSSGDFNVDSYKDQSSTLVVISWLAWIVAVMLLNVMFMNFIIAVISESYEKVMQKLVAESYRVKVQMIVERELQFSDEELKSTKLFPKYMLLRRPVSSDSNEQGEWQGFVKDIKQSIRTVAAKQKTEIIANLKSQNNNTKSFDLGIKSLEKRFGQIDSNLKSNDENIKVQDQSIKQLVTSQKELVTSQNEKFNELEKSITNLNNKISSQDNEIQSSQKMIIQFIEEYRLENQKTQALLQSLQKPQQ
eukprot:403353358